MNRFPLFKANISTAFSSSRQRRALLLPILVLGILVDGSGNTAEAQSIAPDSERRGTIEEVIVTARRVEESLQDTPISVAALSPHELQQIGVSEIRDISAHVPGLEMRKAAGSVDNLVMSMRGMAYSTIDQTVDPPIGVYVDGVYQARPSGMAIDMLNLQRIEVLRGPQGTLFGRNTIGGAVNIITEKPSGEFAFEQEVGYGARGRQRFRTMLDTPRVANLAARLSFQRFKHDGLVSSLYTGREHGRRDSTSFRLALNWQPMDTVEMDYSFDLSRRDSNGNISQYSHVRPIVADPDGALYGGAYYENMAEFADSSRRGKVPLRDSRKDNYSDVDGHALTIEWRVLSNLTLKSISGYRERDQTERSEFGSVAAPDDGSLCASPEPADYDFLTGSCSNPVPAGELVSGFEGIIKQDQEQFSQELQLIGDAFGERLRYTTGLYYMREKGGEENPMDPQRNRLVLAAPMIAPEPLVPQNRGNSIVIVQPASAHTFDHRAYAAYGDFTYTVMPRLDVTLGLRYTVDKREATLDDVIDEERVQLKDNESWNNFNPSLTVNYRWSDEVSTYAKVVTGYRAGGYDVRSVQTHEAFFTPFDEEEVVSYEIGWKTDLLSRSLRFNGAIFYAEYNDRQIASLQTGAEGASPQTLNAGESVHTGLELDVRWQPTAELGISASYAYLDVDIEEFLTERVDPVTALPENAGTVSDISGEASSPYSPDHSATLAVEYQFPRWQWGQLTLRADASYTDEIDFVPQLTRFSRADSHTLLNARATFADIPAGPNDGSLRLALWGRNLTNESVREFGLDMGILGFAQTTYMELASWGIDVVYEFNR